MPWKSTGSRSEESKHKRLVRGQPYSTITRILNGDKDFERRQGNVVSQREARYNTWTSFQTTTIARSLPLDGGSSRLKPFMPTTQSHFWQKYRKKKGKRKKEKGTEKSKQKKRVSIKKGACRSVSAKRPRLASVNFTACCAAVCLVLF